jgi:hypothetical protein
MEQIIEATVKEVIRISHLIESNTATKKDLLKLAILSEFIEKVNRHLI